MQVLILAGTGPESWGSGMRSEREIAPWMSRDSICSVWWAGMTSSLYEDLCTSTNRLHNASISDVCIGKSRVEKLGALHPAAKVEAP
ncbi:uncharacterized protein N7496_004957 [Penicillium cataractarum]|uniref:Uncharacterized protein n=1 Tax=Penicillium cataractarum TaxID=2100454 RepID=A0A9W9SJN2_9EURO|nr:uncharacterized protein N7496_004957 [Penicillium cataractarum]KAJ5377548.1 hypothetical protein N7496_004957 [Penicillium cataractarum]